MIQVQGVNLNISEFPNGETKITYDTFPWDCDYVSNHGEITVSLYYRQDRDLLQLKLVHDCIVDLLGYWDVFPFEHPVPINLRIAYMPYSRMDRPMAGSAFTLRPICEFINSMRFNHVTVLEPHSDVTTALLRHCTASYVCVERFLIDSLSTAQWYDALMFPDAGAQKRYQDVVKRHSTVPTIVGMKCRDSVTDYITSYQIIGDDGIQPKRVLIIDDACTTGWTFYYAAKAIRERYASVEQVELFVTHLDSTVFLGPLVKNDSPIDMIWGTDSVFDDVPLRGNGNQCKDDMYYEQTTCPRIRLIPCGF
jgi:ribose-phosphate pyrophosphokinase